MGLASQTVCKEDVPGGYRCSSLQGWARSSREHRGYSDQENHEIAIDLQLGAVIEVIVNICNSNS